MSTPTIGDRNHFRAPRLRAQTVTGMAMKKKTAPARFTDRTLEAWDFKVHPPGTLELEATDLSARTKDKDAADERIEELQERLYELQVRYWQEKRRAVFVF